MTKKIIGYCAVDSGQLVIVDPCYLGQWKNGDVEFKDGKVINVADNHYAGACQATLSKDLGGQLLVAGVAGTGVAVSTGWGDGNYPVEAVYKEGRVKEVRIKFF